MNTIKLNTIGTPVKKVAGGGASGGGGNYVYFDTSSLTVDDERRQMLLQISYPVKEMMLGGLIVFSTNAMRADVTAPTVAVGIDLNLKITADGSGGLTPKTISLEEMITEYASWILDLPRLTEEEYYNPYIFFLKGSLYNFEEGMTWGEWVDSKYNTAGFVIDNDYILYKGGYVSSGDGSMRAYDTMVSDSYYVNYGE